MKQKGNEWKSRVSKSGKEDEKKKGSRCCNQHVSDGMERNKNSKPNEEVVTFENLANCELQYTTQCSRREVEEFP